MPTEDFLGDYYNNVYWKLRPQRIEKHFVEDNSYREMLLHRLEPLQFLKCKGNVVKLSLDFLGHNKAY